MFLFEIGLGKGCDSDRNRLQPFLPSAGGDDDFLKPGTGRRGGLIRLCCCRFGANRQGNYHRYGAERHCRTCGHRFLPVGRSAVRACPVVAGD
jgi:hypothetical protein